MRILDDGTHAILEEWCGRQDDSYALFARAHRALLGSVPVDFESLRRVCERLASDDVVLQRPKWRARHWHDGHTGRGRRLGGACHGGSFSLVQAVVDGGGEAE